MSILTEEEFVRAICSQLDASIAHLDPAVTARLDQLREAALAPVAHAAQVPVSDRFAADVRSTLNTKAELPADINARLDAARRQAVARMQQRASNPLLVLGAQVRYSLSSLLDLTQIALPAKMLATACLTVTIVSLFYVSSRPAGTLPLEEEMVLIASADDFELVENLEFYLWLADNGIPN